MTRWERHLLIVSQVIVGVILFISGIVAVISTDLNEACVNFVCMLFPFGVAAVHAFLGKEDFRWIW